MLDAVVEALKSRAYFRGTVAFAVADLAAQGLDAAVQCFDRREQGGVMARRTDRRRFARLPRIVLDPLGNIVEPAFDRR